MNDNATPRTVSDVIAEVVRERGETVFGLMGNANSYFMSALTRDGAEVVTVRHETATVIAAETYHLSTGRTACASVTYGAGFANMLLGLAEARIARVPVVVIAGDVPTSGPRHQDFDQTAAALAMGVHTFTVNQHDAAAQTRRAYEIAERDRVPVIVAIPYDLMAAPALDETSLPEVPQTEILPAKHQWGAEELTDEKLQPLADALAAAERPLLLIGRGAVQSGAADAVLALGERIGALYSTSINAERAIESEWDLGIAGGFTAPERAKVMAQADVVIALGASLNVYQMRYDGLVPNATRLIQVDILPSATHHQVTDYVRADVAETAAALVKLLPEQGQSRWRDELGNLDSVHEADTSGLPEFAADGRLDPRALMVKLNTILPEERTVTQDTGHFMGWGARYLDGIDPQSKQLPGLALQTIGIGFACGLGVAYGRKDRLPITILGDGGATMNLAELDTLARTVKSGIAIILNDAAYGMEVHQYVPRGLDRTAMEFPEQDFKKIAESLGAQGITVSSHADLAQVEEWLANGAEGFLVIDARISKVLAADWLELGNEYWAAQAAKADA